MSSLKYSLPFRILIVSFILLVIPLLLFVFFAIKSSYQEHLTQAQDNLINISKQKEGNLAQATSSKLLLLEEIAYMLDIPKLLPHLPDEKKNQVFKHLVATGGIWGLEIHKITPEGRFINVCSDQPHFLGEDSTVLYINVIDILHRKKATILRNSSRPPHEELFMSTMLIESNDHPIATFTMAVDMTQFLKILLTPLYTPYKINFALLSEVGVVFSASDPDLCFQLFKSLSPQLREYLTESQLYDDHQLAEKNLDLTPIPNSPFFEFKFKGMEQLAYQTSIPNSEIRLISYVAKDAISSQIFLRFIPVFVLFCLIFLLGGLIVYILTRLMAKPFLKLATCMEDAKNNNYQTRYAPDRFGFEINYLGEIFNDMILSMRDYLKRAEEERAKREAIAQELKIGHDVQRQILPQRMPSYPKVDLAECYIPAKEVGGDFYDAFIQETDGRKNLFFRLLMSRARGFRLAFILWVSAA